MVRISAALRKANRDDWIKVGARARQIREALAVTQSAMAERLQKDGRISVSAGELSRIETGAAELPRHWMPQFAKLDPQKRGLLWLAYGPEAVEEERERVREEERRNTRPADPLPPGMLTPVERKGNPLRIERA
jgi:transcriptional regulator with XRE-family HTH domain